MRTLGLEKKKILVTGVDGQLGTALRKALIDEGAYVLGADINSSQTAFKLDISNRSEIEDYVEIQSILDGKIDGLVNNAAVSFKGLNISDKQFSKTMDVNINGTHNCMTELKPMITQGGSIVNVSSVYGLISPNFDLYDGNEQLYSSAAYGASKAAIVQMTKYYAVQYAPDIRVNAISPGGIFNGHDSKFMSKYSDRVPFRRMAEVDEIVNGILFLLSPMSSYITGHNLVVDGGMSIW